MSTTLPLITVGPTFLKGTFLTRELAINFFLFSNPAFLDSAEVELGLADEVFLFWANTFIEQKMQRMHIIEYLVKNEVMISCCLISSLIYYNQ
jgi:hypothetical protein